LFLLGPLCFFLSFFLSFFLPSFLSHHLIIAINNKGKKTKTKRELKRAQCRRNYREKQTKRDGGQDQDHLYKENKNYISVFNFKINNKQQQQNTTRINCSKELVQRQCARASARAHSLAREERVVENEEEQKQKGRDEDATWQENWRLDIIGWSTGELGFHLSDWTSRSANK
jgi:hypothetical protein